MARVSLFLLVLVLGCGSGEPSGSTARSDPSGQDADGTHTEAITSAAVLSPAVAALPIDANEAVETMGLEAVKELYRDAFASATSSADVERIYLFALTLEGPLTTDVGARIGKIHDEGGDAFAVMQEYMNADLGVPGMRPTCAAECTEPVAEPEREAFEALAAKTPETDDDALLSLVFDFWETGGWTSVFVRTWDYGGYSTLGDGLFASFLRRVQTLDTPLQGFQGLAESVRRDLFGQMGNTCVGGTAEAVLAELETIQSEIRMTPGEQEILNTTAEAYADPGDGVEFNCADGGCSCTSG